MRSNESGTGHRKPVGEAQHASIDRRPADARTVQDNAPAEVQELSDIQKLERLLPYWINHNRQHMLDHEKWKSRALACGLKRVAEEIDRFIALSKDANAHIERAQKFIEQEKRTAAPEKVIAEKERHRPVEERIERYRVTYRLKPIGVIRTPYTDRAPYQPVASDEGEFRLCVDPAYVKGLADLDRFRYIYVLYFIHRLHREPTMSVSPPWTPGKKVGLFSSRSPVRPNPLGLSIVAVKRVAGNEVFTSGLDVFDGTPLLDIKPYLKDLDNKNDSNYGWLEDIDDREHLLLHIKGIPHDY